MCVPVCVYLHSRVYLPAHQFLYNVFNLHPFEHFGLRFADLMNRVFANDPGDRGSISGRVRLKKMVLYVAFLNTQIIRYGSRVKWSKPGNRIVLSLTPLCSSY